MTTCIIFSGQMQFSAMMNQLEQATLFSVNWDYLRWLLIFLKIWNFMGKINIYKLIGEYDIHKGNENSFQVWCEEWLTKFLEFLLITSRYLDIRIDQWNLSKKYHLLTTQFCDVHLWKLLRHSDNTGVRSGSMYIRRCKFSKKCIRLCFNLSLSERITTSQNTVW